MKREEKIRRIKVENFNEEKEKNMKTGSENDRK